MTWYYIKTGALDDETIGPLEDEAFLAEVREGKHKPKVMVASEQHTGGQWAELQSVPVLRRAFKLGQQQRERQKELARAEKEREKAKAAEDRKREAARRAEQTEQARVRRQAEQQIQAKQRARNKELQQWEAETRQVFSRYWMADYLKTIWSLTLVVTTAIVGLAWLGTLGVFIASLVGGISLTASLAMCVPSIASAVVFSVAAGVYLIFVRLSLETLAVIFDIRGLLKKQEHWLRQLAASGAHPISASEE